jgi:hypothetical protein
LYQGSRQAQEILEFLGFPVLLFLPLVLVDLGILVCP